MAPSLADSLVIKDENVFLVTPPDGDFSAAPGQAFGLWYRDCRFLSAHELRLDGGPPVPLAGSDRLGNTAVLELTDARQSLSARCERTVGGSGRLRQVLTLRNHQRADTRLALELVLAADFEPMLAVRGLVERAERPPVGARLDGAVLSFAALGRDGVERRTEITLGAAPADAALADATATLRFDLDIPAGGGVELVLEVVASESGAEPAGTGAAPVERTRVRSDDELFDRVLERSLLDLRVLRSRLHGHSYYAAGVPWYATLFGRDSLIAATQMLAFAPDVAAGTLRLLGGLLGRDVDDTREEQPGRVLHELRVGEPAALGETPFARYYGTADATPLWLSLLADHADWAGDLDLFRELRSHVEAALGWMERHGDADSDGLIEYERRAPHGLINQGWKDSWDGVPNAGGSPLEGPIALVEVQGYAIRALRRVAGLFELDGDGDRARRLRERADAVELALERFWLPESGSYAIGLDGAKRPGSGLTSNPGHLLWAGALPGERAAHVRDVLMGDALFSGWGLRTLAHGHPGYNPIGYHTGSVWPHDNALIACGLRDYGFDADFMRIFDALLEASAQLPGYRLPELFGGQPRTPAEGPVPYPVACRPQAWAAGAIPHLLCTGLGLRAEGLDRRMRLVRPTLPPWLDRLELDGLRVADASVDLRFERSGGQVTLADARIDGELELVVEGP